MHLAVDESDAGDLSRFIQWMALVIQGDVRDIRTRQHQVVHVVENSVDIQERVGPATGKGGIANNQSGVINVDCIRSCGSVRQPEIHHGSRIQKRMVGIALIRPSGLAHDLSEVVDPITQALGEAARRPEIGHHPIERRHGVNAGKAGNLSQAVNSIACGVQGTGGSQAMRTAVVPQNPSLVIRFTPLIWPESLMSNAWLRPSPANECMLPME